jgi:type II secretory pathway component GspD/PulD (secretin)
MVPRALHLVFLLLVAGTASAQTAPGPIETRRFALRHMPAERAAALYRELVDSRAVILELEGGHFLRIEGFPDHLARFQALLAELDREGAAGRRVYVRPALYRDAAELAGMVLELAASTDRLDADVFPDDRTGQLVVVATPDTYRRIHRLLLRLDVPEEGSAGRRVWVETAPPGGLPDGLGGGGSASSARRR